MDLHAAEIFGEKYCWVGFARLVSELAFIFNKTGATFTDDGFAGGKF